MTPVSSTTTTVTYIGDGVTKSYDFSFPYLDPTHIFVYVDGVAAAASRSAQQTWTLTTVPPRGAVVSVERHTQTEPFVNFRDGSTITAEMLDQAEAQARYIAEEARDLANRGLQYNPALQAYDAKGKRITHVGDAVYGSDALNKGQLDTTILRLVGAELLADYLEEMLAIREAVAADRDAVESQYDTMQDNLDYAESLRDSVAAGPDGATIAQRITDYLGSDAWIGGGGVTTTIAGSRRYWRVKFFRNVNNLALVGNVAVREIEFRTSPGVPNPASGGTIIYSSPGTTTPGDAFDGDVTTFGNRGNVQLNVAGGAFLGYYKTTPQPIASVWIHSSPDRPLDAPREFDIEYSDDGATWTVALSVTNQTGWTPGVPREYVLPLLPGSYTKTTFDASGVWTKPGIGRLAYIQVWGKGGNNSGGGGGYAERYIPMVDLPATVNVTIDNVCSFGTFVSANRGSDGGSVTGGNGGGPGVVNLGGYIEGLGSTNAGYGGVYFGGGGAPTGQAGHSVYGGGGGGQTGGQSVHGGAGGGTDQLATVPGGGGGPGQSGAHGRVIVTYW